MNIESTYDYSHWAAYGCSMPLKHIRNADVKHDIDLIRQIMIQLRDKEDLKAAPVFVEGYEPVLVARHVMRLHDAGLVEGNVSKTIGPEAPLVFATDLSVEGHNFLAALETKPVWKQLKEKLTVEELASLSVKKLSELAGDLALQLVKRKLGLDG
ncbi:MULTISPECIES: DUF2513 domain-containing protein [unclassified Brucella]|uniref:DUF2513 domain-containing protein n=1 Tax=unclassified Brucella TaxID=2632610 RepID=UPI0018A0BCB2|nr:MULTISPECIES: DUF2513 domain-containing protein [unclassified Brucella]